MKFVSSRGGAAPHSFAEAVSAGLAPDGGLFVPESLPDLSGDLEKWRSLGYADLASEFLRRFAGDIEPAGRRSMAETYSRFSHPEVAPLRSLGRGLYVLELFHGPTLAFKDFALQWLGRLQAAEVRSSGHSVNVLGATSGDTGAAAIQGMLAVPGAAIFILYPDGKIAPLQERQMACTGAANVFALAIDGTFDDAQAALKAILGNAEFRARHRIAAVNSINLARILAQCVYYLFAWLRLPAAERESAEFVVPTGNFGNVLAGWLLTRMGVPIRGFKVATNQNDILHRFFTTGEYRVGAVMPSLAPSMDIQVASNFERFLYYQFDRDAPRVRRAMEDLKSKGSIRIEGFERGAFSSSHCTDSQISGIIRKIHDKHGYVVDPHTACGFADLAADRPSVVLATASPAKFPDTIRNAIHVEPTHPSLEALKGRPIVKHRLDADPAAIRAFIEARAV